ncbi:MAG: 2-hydroxyacid dehydrogenase [Hyphomicrobiaceae bacterium]
MPATVSPGAKRLRIVIARALPEPVLARFRSAHDVWVNPDDRTLTAEELLAQAAGADALVITAYNRFDAAMFDRLPASVRMVATYSVGFEHIDLEAARKRGIAVLFTPDVLSDSVAEMAILLMLGAARRVHDGTALLYGGGWGGWTPTQLVGLEITGKRLGILGMGRIGQTIARRARGFDMQVHYHNRQRLAPDLEAGATHHAALPDFLAHCDVLVLAAPSTPATRGILNAAAIGAMPEGAVVVNIARGDLVDDEALIGALKRGRIAAAGLDVFNGEPKLDPRYTSLSNVFLQPHQGSSTMTARLKMGDILLTGFAAIMAGRTPPNRLV